MTIQSDEYLFFKTKSPGITIIIKNDKYWLLKRALFYTTLFSAILLNYYLLDSNLFSLIGIVLIYCFVEDNKSIFLRMRLKKSKKLLTKIESDYQKKILKKCFRDIQQDNTVLFLYKADFKLFKKEDFKLKKYFKTRYLRFYINNIEVNKPIASDIKSLTILLSIANKDTLQKANNVAKELKKEYGVEKVNVVALHCFVENPPPAWAIVNQDGSFGCFDEKEQKMKNAWFDKLITTNSTSIVKVESSEKLEVIDCFDIFNDYLKQKN